MALAALPTANLIFPTGTIFAERLAYLPSAGFCLIVAAWICGGRTAPPGPPAVAGRAPVFADMPRARFAVLAALAVLLSMRTIVRNPVWASDEALFTNMVAVSPGSAKAHYDYAYMSAQTGHPRRALDHYRRATEIYPGYWDAWAGRGRMERELGNPEASQRAYEQTLRLFPGSENGYFGIGMARERLGDPNGAETAYRDGLRRNPRSLPLAYRLALLLSAEERPAALFAWRRALAIEPRSAAVREGLRRWELSESARRAGGTNRAR
jgi:predicted Zn-dependent protease